MQAVMWTKTDFPNGTCNLRTATIAKGATFEKILQNQATDIFVGSALPGQMEIGIDMAHHFPHCPLQTHVSHQALCYEAI